MDANELKEIARRRANLSHAVLNYAVLSGANLSGADLNHAVLNHAVLSGANLGGADLNYAVLSGAVLSGANLSGANLNYANLSDAVLSHAVLSDAVLSGANLSGANLSGAVLSDAVLSGANLSGANLSGAKGTTSAAEWMTKFERDDLGWIVYKRIGSGLTNHNPPPTWTIEAGSFLTEVVNPNRQDDCGCGVNFGTRAWCLAHYKYASLWRCRIRYEDGPGIVVPYNTDGKARCERLELIEITKEEPNT